MLDAHRGGGVLEMVDHATYRSLDRIDGQRMQHQPEQAAPIGECLQPCVVDVARMVVDGTTGRMRDEHRSVSAPQQDVVEQRR